MRKQLVWLAAILIFNAALAQRGLAQSTVVRWNAAEMGAKGDLGVDLILDSVPTRETGMSAYEMMLSESQERMLMVLKPEKEKEAEAIFRKWGLDFAVVGYTTPSKRFVVKHGGDVMADLPIKELGDEAPLYDRPHVASNALPVVHAREVSEPMGVGAALEKLIGTPELCSKRWVWEQYDHVILGNTVQRPGGDAAVVRVHGSDVPIRYARHPAEVPGSVVPVLQLPLSRQHRRCGSWKHHPAAGDRSRWIRGSPARGTSWKPMFGPRCLVIGAERNCEAGNGDGTPPLKAGLND